MRGVTNTRNTISRILIRKYDTWCVFWDGGELVERMKSGELCRIICIEKCQHRSNKQYIISHYCKKDTIREEKKRVSP